ncbi:MAG: hypothetical protein JWO03_1592 [Bacteroidetes bacterium]|nr:hypothetical protein [Bacteroidota bacterium]
MSIRSTVMAFLSLFIIIFSTSGCKKGCKACDYGETCNQNSGYCFCPNGFEGDSCHIYSALKFINLNYYVSDPCSGSAGYTVYITADQSYPNRLYIQGLFNLGQAVEADIFSNSSKQGVDLGIQAQNLGAVQVEGTGIYQQIAGRARITLNLEYTSNGIGSNCTVILNQQ